MPYLTGNVNMCLFIFQVVICITGDRIECPVRFSNGKQSAFLRNEALVMNVALNDSWEVVALGV